MKLRLILMVTIFYSLSCSLGFCGDHVGNDAVVVDGTEYRLADLYFRPHPGSTFVVDGPLKERLQLLSRVLRRWKLNVAPFFRAQIESTLVSYKFVSTLPPECNDPMDIDGLPTIQFACTKGYMTWIIPKYFIKLSLHERAAAIVHERLHAFAPHQPHDVIAPFVAGLVLFQSLYELRRTVTASEMGMLEEMRLNSRRLGMEDECVIGTPCKLTPLGGGVTDNTSLPGSAFLSVGSSLLLSTLSEGATIVGSSIYDAKIGTSATVVDSEISVDQGMIGSPTTIGDKVVIQKSTVGGYNVGSESKITSSFINPNHWFHEQAVMGSHVEVENSKLISINVGSGARILNSERCFNGDNDPGEPVKPNPVIPANAVVVGEHGC